MSVFPLTFDEAEQITEGYANDHGIVRGNKSANDVLIIDVQRKKGVETLSMDSDNDCQKFDNTYADGSKFQIHSLIDRQHSGATAPAAGCEMDQYTNVLWADTFALKDVQFQNREQTTTVSVAEDTCWILALQQVLVEAQLAR
eukprot:TRINITY_DN65449_c1_g1_i2.p1 TRINITY_DN65449_c1_g1~~TRINITY_DN65449_c1_g1_i2.p1  ORF type:complete len:153 (-),score=21.35 TRINITY_DN65449_c1_g1_i2:470-898(-)